MDKEQIDHTGRKEDEQRVRDQRQAKFIIGIFLLLVIVCGLSIGIFMYQTIGK
ncbi:hypothetical protein [Brevibacillus massiliensis]|uniref:hypothetical protein n=1 Tax=Brevibacillus massiliensis TaxID=1118054 RepID=UPI00030A2E20|nr:hypothetical protein [Brevibacillus massiliensis]